MTAHVTVYSRPGCHLCEDAVRDLTHLQTQMVSAETPFTLEEVNIETDPALEAKYGEQIPVILLNGVFVSEYTVDQDQFRRLLLSYKGE